MKWDANKALRGVGSFWLEELSTEATLQAVKLVETALTAPGALTSQMAGSSAINEAATTLADVLIPFSSYDVSYSHGADDELPENSGVVVLPRYVFAGNLGKGASHYAEVWEIHVPHHALIDAFYTNEGALWVAGIHYSARRGSILVSTSPKRLFPGGRIPARACRMFIPTVLHALQGAGRLLPNCGKYLSSYRKGKRTSSNLVRAAAEFAGYLVFPTASRILAAQPLPGVGTAYATDSGSFIASYAHPPLAPGDFVEEGHILGLAFEVFSKESFALNSSSTDPWWSALVADLDEPTLDRFCTVKGVPSHHAAGVGVQITTNNDVPTYTFVEPQPWYLDRLTFLAYEHRAVTAAPATLPEGQYANTMAMLFELMLGECAVIVKLKGGSAPLNDAMEHFFEEERPASKFVFTIKQA